MTDTYLWASVADDANNGYCQFCGMAAQVVTFEVLSSVVEDVLGDLYVSVDESGVFHDDGEWSQPVEDVQVILEDLLNGAVENDVLTPLVAFIADRSAVPYGFVLRRNLWASLYEFDEGAWRSFMMQARDGNITIAAQNFLRKVSAEILELFRRIVRVAQFEGLYRRSTPVLWRCRPGAADDDYKTADKLGSPPVEFASAGRLNARNQSVFYGSTSLSGAIIEMVHRHGEDAELWAGQFTPSRQLYYLDVMEPPRVPSPFAPGAADTNDAISFLIRFAETIRERNNRDTRHYLPTQIFVAYLIAADEDLRPDGIRYGSSVDPTSENWVVFADHQHCDVLGNTTDYPDDEVFMLLDQNTAHFVGAATTSSAFQPCDPAPPDSSNHRAAG